MAESGERQVRDALEDAQTELKAVQRELDESRAKEMAREVDLMNATASLSAAETSLLALQKSKKDLEDALDARGPSDIAAIDPGELGHYDSDALVKKVRAELIMAQRREAKIKEELVQLIILSCGLGTVAALFGHLMPAWPSEAIVGCCALFCGTCVWVLRKLGK